MHLKRDDKDKVMVKQFAYSYFMKNDSFLIVSRNLENVLTIMFLMFIFLINIQLYQS